MIYVPCSPLTQIQCLIWCLAQCGRVFAPQPTVVLVTSTTDDFTRDRRKPRFYFVLIYDKIIFLWGLYFIWLSSFLFNLWEN